MKRWFIARMGDYENEGTLVPATLKYRPSGQLRADLLNDPAVPSRVWSKPGFGWCFGQLAVADITLLQADPDIYILPDGAMDMSVGSIPAGVRTTMRTRLENAGFVFTDVKTSWTVRQLLVYLLKQIQPPLNTVEQGDVIDVA
jgi:hypothetical protein